MRRWRPIQLVELVLLVASIACLGWFGWNWIASEVDQRWSSYQLDAARKGHKPSVGEFITESVKPRKEQREIVPAPAPKEPEKKAAEAPKKAPEKRARYLKRGDLIGRVEIPRLKIKAVVRYGVDDGTLKRAVGHVPGTALPGQPGNVAIAAHRDTLFRNLKGVKEGDLIRFVTRHGTFEYQVQNLDIVSPKNTEVLNPTPEPALTLVTCYPFNYVGSAPKRFIVRAKQTTEAQTATVGTPEPKATKKS
jgi:sortase A